MLVPKIEDFSLDERIALRPTILDSIEQTGAYVSRTEIDGHLVAVIAPGPWDGISNAAAPELARRIAEHLEQAARTFRNNAVAVQLAPRMPDATEE